MFNIMTTNVPIIRSALWARAAILGVRGLLGISTLALRPPFSIMAANKMARVPRYAIADARKQNIKYLAARNSDSAVGNSPG